MQELEASPGSTAHAGAGPCSTATDQHTAIPTGKNPHRVKREKVATGKLPTKWPEELGLFAFIFKL